MSAAKRLTACLFVTVTCLAVLLAARDWPRARPPAAEAEYLPPGEDVKLLQRRSGAREVVIERLLAGESTLLEAAARFQQINNHPPALGAKVDLFPGKSIGEKLCRQVLRWICGHLRGKGLSPQDVGVALAPFECELQRLLEQNEEIALPPVDEPAGETEKR